MAAKLVQSDLTKSTLFVRNLPFDATNTELETFFGTVGPIKACFVVTDKPGESVAEGAPITIVTCNFRAQ